MKDKIKDILNTYDKAFVPDKILDLPVKGLKVTRGYNQNENAFEVGLEYESPLTIGEALKMLWNLLIDMIYRRRIKRLPNSAMNWQVQRVAEAIEININLNKN